MATYTTIGREIATKQVSVATTATEIVPRREGRRSVHISRIDTAQLVHLGPAGVTAGNGFRIAAADTGTKTFETSAAIFGIATVAAQNVSVLEIFS